MAQTGFTTRILNARARTRVQLIFEVEWTATHSAKPMAQILWANTQISKSRRSRTTQRKWQWAFRAQQLMAWTVNNTANRSIQLTRTMLLKLTLPRTLISEPGLSTPLMDEDMTSKCKLSIQQIKKRVQEDCKKSRMITKVRRYPRKPPFQYFLIKRHMTLQARNSEKPSGISSRHSHSIQAPLMMTVMAWQN